MNKQITVDQSFVRKVNTLSVMDTLRLFAPLSRAELSARTGLNRSTISSIIGELIQDGYVQETTLQDPKIGRPGMLLQLSPNGGFAIGIEIGVDFFSIILANFTAEVLWRKRVFHDAHAPSVQIIEQAEILINEALEVGTARGLRPLGIGVGLPGLVDARQGKLVYAPNLGWSDMPLRLMWTRRFNLPVFVENEANSGAMGEYFFGAAHGKEDFIYMSTGIGLGGGIMIGGKLFKGSNGYAGEIGHTTIYAGGEQCNCGSRGCWETYVGPQAIIRRIRQTLEEGHRSAINDLVHGDLDQLTVDVVVEAAASGDSIALKALRDVGIDLGAGISNLINIFNPELVVVGGVLSPASPWLLPIIQESIHQNTLPPLVENVSVVPSQLGLDSCVLGAVALVLDDVVREPLYSMLA
jgi:glucokinase-like ROK family protein